MLTASLLGDPAEPGQSCFELQLPNGWHREISLFSIKHNQLTAIINPLGAELSSFESNSREYLWQGDKNIWSGRAPILFPIVGSLINNQMSYRGKVYSMARHGIARKEKFSCIEQTNSKLLMSLRSDAKLLKMYPWDFELTVHFSLSNDTLSITYEVTNHDSDTMIFTLGSHPAFILPATGSNSEELLLDDYDIQFDQHETLRRVMLDDAGLLSVDSQAFKLENNAISLSETIFEQDALVFKNIESEKLTLRCKHQPRLVVDTGGAPHLGIWAKPGARFVCIEPWYGTSDYSDSDGNFINKPDMLSLPPGEIFRHTIRITVA